MLKFLKKFFVYEEPSVTDMEMGYEFLEEPSESAAWGKKDDSISSQQKENVEQGKSGDLKDGGQEERKDRQEGSDQTGSKDRQEKTQDSRTGNEEKVQDKEQAGQEENRSYNANEPSEQEDTKNKEDKKQRENESKQENNRQQEDEEKQEENSQQEDSNRKDYLRTQLDVQNRLMNIIRSGIENNGNGDGIRSDMACRETLPKSPRILMPKPIDELTVHKGRKHKDKKAGKNKNSSDNKEGKSEQKENDNQNKNQNDNESVSNSAENGSKSRNDKKNKQDDGKRVSTSLDENIKYLKERFHMPTNQDVIIREFNVAHKIPACVVFIDGMIDKNIIIQFTLPQLMDINPFSGFEGGCALDFIEKNVLPVHQIVRMDRFKEIISQILSGLTVIFIDGCDECLVMESRGFEKRSISAPVTETVVQGSQEGFTENMRTNITLVRRIIKNEDLITEFKTLSKRNNLLAALLYIEGIVNPRIIEEVKRRVDNLDIDYIAGSGMLVQMIEDKSSMLFPQVISTERPDRVASFLMDGKAVLICEGTPFALAMPTTFFDLYHTSEEANLRWQYGSFMRLVRLVGILLAALLPGMYTGLILFHQEMIPTPLLSSIIVSRAAVPFPTILELLLMEFSFELIREGGIRVPGVTGNTLGIIGALILGQAAVQAGLVSPILIIIVAVSGLGSFAIPNYSLSLGVRIVRFILIFFGYLGGFYGISAGVTILFAVALSMKSFGVPFFTPFAPAAEHNKDIIFRGPIQSQKYRPDFLNAGIDAQEGDEPRGWKTQDKQEEQ